MQILKLHNPKKLVFGDHCLNSFIDDMKKSPWKKIGIIADQYLQETIQFICETLHQAGIDTIVDTSIISEPTMKHFSKCLMLAEKENVDAIVGLGGGSVLDVAKLVAALYRTSIDVRDAIGIGKILGRSLPLYCLPTTAGTGSEVSPNAILLDESQNLKVGIISEHLVPDASYIDPCLTYSVPYEVTASTGIDALTHCLEAYANKNAHPITDLYALEGIRLIYHNLEKACINETEARNKVALGSLYGGLCLGPVNTAAVHALSYPLGSAYKIPHGVSNALLLPYVIEANLPFGSERYANIATAIGVKHSGSEVEIAREGIKLIKDLCVKIGIPQSLNAFNIPRTHVPELAQSAMKVQRLLVNNPRELKLEEVMEIYYNLF